MGNISRGAVTMGLVLILTAALATAAIGRSGKNAAFRGRLAVDAVACSDAGGSFYSQAWRVPPEYFDGYHCIFAPTPAGGASSGPTADEQAAAAKRCTTADHGEYMTFTVSDAPGYACTWLRR